MSTHKNSKWINKRTNIGTYQDWYTLPWRTGSRGAVFPHAMFPASERAARACLFPLHLFIIQIYLLYQSFKVQSIVKISPSRFIIPKIKNKINKNQEATTHKISQPKKCSGAKTGPNHRVEKLAKSNRKYPGGNADPDQPFCILLMLFCKNHTDSVGKIRHSDGIHSACAFMLY